MELDQPVVKRVRRTAVRRLAETDMQSPAPTPAPMPEPSPMPMPETHVAPGKASNKALLIGVLAVVLTVGAVFGVKTFISSSAASKASGSKAPGGKGTDEVSQLIDKVGKHILIKREETPAVATVVDPDSLRQQNPGFYKDAIKGDRLFIWTDKAILYSPSRDILLAVMPIPQQVAQQAQQAAAQQAQQQQQPSADAAEKANIEVRNGSGTAGEGKKLADALKAAGLTTLKPGDAKGKDAYHNTLIVNVSGKPLPKTLQALQQATGGQLSELPAAEGKPKGDILVIIGADYAAK